MKGHVKIWAWLTINRNLIKRELYPLYFLFVYVWNKYTAKFIAEHKSYTCQPTPRLSMEGGTGVALAYLDTAMKAPVDCLNSTEWKMSEKISQIMNQDTAMKVPVDCTENGKWASKFHR